MKKFMGYVAAACLALPANVFASASPFSDVPSDSWAYGAVEQLVQDGVLHGYADGTFRGDRPVTRFEMAQAVAKAIVHEDTLSDADKATLAKLKAEFADELQNLGVRVEKLERSADMVTWHGDYAQKFMQSQHTGPNGSRHGDPYFEKVLDLNPEAKIPGTDWVVHAAISTKMGGNKWNGEEVQTETWNGGIPRSNGSRIDKVYVEGPLGKTGQTMKLGLFQPWVQNGMIDDATMKGVMFDHYGDGFATHAFYGRLDIKDWDAAVNGKLVESTSGEWQQDNTGNSATDTFYGVIEPYNEWGDFVRHHSERAFPVRTVHYDGGGKYDWKETGTTNYPLPTDGSAYGSDNNYDPTTYRFMPQTKTVFAFVLDKRLGHEVNSSFGYYHYKSAAYNQDALQIGMLSFDWRIRKMLNLNLAYAHGNQGGHDNAWNIELKYNPDMPWDRAGAYNFWIAWRALGPDALIKTNYGDAIGAGQRGIEVGTSYNLAKNIQLTLKYGWGHSMTYNNLYRSKFYSCLTFGF